MSSDGFPYPVDVPGNFSTEQPTAKQLMPFGYAAGGYQIKCPACKNVAYDLDKRAFRCWQCAVNAFRAAEVKASVVSEDAPRVIGRDDIVDRLRKAYGFLRDEGHFVSADTCLVALTEIQRLRADPAQGIEARSAETQGGSAVGESPVTAGHAPDPKREGETQQKETAA